MEGLLENYLGAYLLKWVIMFDPASSVPIIWSILGARHVREQPLVVCPCIETNKRACWEVVPIPKQVAKGLAILFSVKSQPKPPNSSPSFGLSKKQTKDQP